MAQRRGNARTRTRRAAQLGLGVLLTGILSISLAAPVGAVPPPPPNPSDAELAESQAKAQISAAEVGKLSGKLSVTQTKIEQLHISMQLKAELAMKARVDLEMAQDEYEHALEEAQQAQKAADEASSAIDEARAGAADFAAASYRQGGSMSSLSALLNAGSMEDFMARNQMIAQVSGTQHSAVRTLQTARTQKTNLDSQAKAALQAAQAAEKEAEAAKLVADEAKVAAEKSFRDGEQQLKSLEKQLAVQQAEYQDALNTAAGLQGQREQYNAWLEQKEAEDERIAYEAALQRDRILAAEQEKQRADEAARSQSRNKAAAQQAEKKRQDKLLADKIARQKAADAAKRNNSGGSKAGSGSGSGSGSGGGAGSKPATPPASSLARGRQVVNSALKYIGVPYAWGGGNQYGPTRGIRDGGVADRHGDYRKIGFDCSGLALYAWAQVGVYLPHYSAYQFRYGKRVAVNQLQPGDLVFYAYNTSNPATIHHVAIYMGDGKMVEAPQSGMVVRVTSMRWSGYIGATRPGT